MTTEITPQGLVVDSAAEIKARFDAAFSQIFGASILVDGEVPVATSIGQEIQILTDSESNANELLQALVAAFDPDQAEFPFLDILCALTGTRRRAALASQALVTCFGTAGTVLTVNGDGTAPRVVTNVDTGSRWDSLPSATDTHAPGSTLALVTATWATGTAYARNDLVVANSVVWQCTVAGTSSGGGSGPTGGAPFSTQTDGMATWMHVCASTLGVALVEFASEQLAAVAAPSLKLSQIATPVSGWQGCVNALDAVPGRPIETEPALRARRLRELQSNDGGPPDAIRAFLESLPTTAYPIAGSVENCIVFVNSGNAVDGNGVPAHGVEIVILDPTVGASEDQILANAVWHAVGAGTATGGTTTKTVKDASGNSQSVSFTRPSAVPVYVALTVDYDPSVWTGSDPSASVTAAVQSAIMTFAASYAIGEQVRASPIAGAAEAGLYYVDSTGTPQVATAAQNSGTLPGIVEIRNGAGTDGTLPYIGTAPSPVTSTTVAIGTRQLATISAAHITVTVVPLSP